MIYAVDTNLLVRLLQTGHPSQRETQQALLNLLGRGETVCLFPQMLYELWVVATRPLAQNGLGLDFTQAGNELAKLKSFLTFVPDVPQIYSAWEALVIGHAVLGRNAHDARIAAAMRVHLITNLLTYNGSDFKRYSFITVITPSEILNPSSTTP